MAGGAAADDGAEDDGAGEDHGVGAGAAAGGVLGVDSGAVGTDEVPMICRRTCESTIEGMLKHFTSASSLCAGHSETFAPLFPHMTLKLKLQPLMIAQLERTQNTISETRTNSASNFFPTTIGPSAKRHSNGVSLAGQ